MTGLRDEVQREVGASFDRDLADAVVSFTLLDKKASVYNPETGVVTPVTASYASRGVLTQRRYREVLATGGAIDELRNTLIVLQNELAVTPLTDHEIVVGTRTFRVVSAVADAASAAWILVLH